MLFVTMLCRGLCGAKGYRRKFEKKPLVSNLVSITCSCNTLNQAHICKDHEYNVSIIKNLLFLSNSCFISRIKRLPLQICDKYFNFDVYLKLIAE